MSSSSPHNPRSTAGDDVNSNGQPENWATTSGVYDSAGNLIEDTAPDSDIEQQEYETPRDHIKVKDRELKPFDTLMLDDAQKEKILQGLIMNVRRRAGEVKASLKSIMNDLMGEVMRDHHLLREEFIELLEKNGVGDGTDSSRLIANLLEGFFLGLQERRDARMRSKGGAELPLPEEVDQAKLDMIRHEFRDFISVYGTKKEEKKVYMAMEKLEEKYPNINVIDCIKSDQDIMRDLTERIVRETIAMSSENFKKYFKEDRNILDFLFARVLGKQGDAILTLEGPRKQFIMYLESIGFRLENLDRLLAKQPEFKAREEVQKARRQQRMKMQAATGEPVFGLSGGNSFHSWFAKHFIKDIRDQRVPQFRMDLAETRIVNMGTMSRIIVPKAEMRDPIRMLVKEAKGRDGESELYERLELDDLPVSEARAMINREIDGGKRTIDKITREVLHFVPDSEPEKKMAVLIPTIRDERELKNLLEWCDSPSSFLDDNPEARDWIAETYGLREYATGYKDLHEAVERIVGHQARIMLEFWYKSHDVLPGGDRERLNEKTRLYDKKFRKRFGIISEEIKRVKLRWRILREVTESGEPVMRDFTIPFSEPTEVVKVPSYEYEKVNDGENDNGEDMRIKEMDGAYYRPEEIEEVDALYQVNLHYKGEMVTVYFFSPDFESTGMLWNCKPFESRMISQLRQGEREPTDGTRTCVAVERSEGRQMRMAKEFLFGHFGGTTVKVEDPKSGRLKKKDRPSVTAVLSAHHRAGQLGAKHHMHTEDGRMVTETVETQLYTIRDLCIGWLSQKTVMSHNVYDADRSLGLFQDVLYPSVIYPAMRDFNNRIPSYKPH